LVIYPSRYMEEWCRRYYPNTAPYLILPNAMVGETRRFKPVERSRRTIKKVVFFGRIELRKGIDVFLDAIEGVLRAGRSDFEVIFLGRFGESVTQAQLERRISSWECTTTVLTNYGNTDAIDLLRSEECLAVIPSRIDNVPFTIYECLENGHRQGRCGGLHREDIGRAYERDFLRFSQLRPGSGRHRSSGGARAIDV
jgi:glycosyltransferase involved in cell wall biosynthesis